MSVKSKKTYLGLHGHHVYVETDTSSLPLKHRVRHSPTGFSWSYGGSGPSDLALSILWDHLGEEPTVDLYQAFKWEFVAKSRESWRFTSQQIDQWLEAYRDGTGDSDHPSRAIKDDIWGAKSE